MAEGVGRRPMGTREIGGFQVEVTRKVIKNLHLRVRPDGTITLSVPRFTTDWEIKRFVTMQSDWIKERQASLAQRPNLQTLKFVTGENLPVWGEEYVLKVTEAPRISLILLSGEAHLQRPAGSTRKQCEDYLREWYRKELKENIARLTKKMNRAAAELNFEEAAVLRDELKKYKVALRDYDR